jgi:hypothetical protein
MIASTVVTTDLLGGGPKVLWLPKGETVFTTLSLILAEIEFAPLDARVLTRTVRAVRIPHYPNWQADWFRRQTRAGFACRPRFDVDLIRLRVVNGWKRIFKNWR